MKNTREVITDMKNDIRKGACKKIINIACAFFIATIVWGVFKVSANAATRTFDVDLTSGKAYSIDFGNASNITTDENTQKAFLISMVIVMFNESHDEANTRFVMSSSPSQIVLASQTDSAVTFSADSSSIGNSTYVLSKDTISNAINKAGSEFSELAGDNDSAEDFMKEFELIFGDEAANGTSVYTVNFKFSDDPVKVEADKQISFEVGKEIISEGLKYKFVSAEGDLSFTGVVSDQKNIVIPDTVTYDGYTLKVTEIADKALKGNKKVKKVTIGSNVTKIGKQAFFKAKKLKKVIISSVNISSVGKKAFGKNDGSLVIKVNKSVKKQYKKMFKRSGVSASYIK